MPNAVGSSAAADPTNVAIAVTIVADLLPLSAAGSTPRVCVSASAQSTRGETAAESTGVASSLIAVAHGSIAVAQMLKPNSHAKRRV